MLVTGDDEGDGGPQGFGGKSQSTLRIFWETARIGVGDSGPHITLPSPSPPFHILHDPESLPHCPDLHLTFSCLEGS